jgi:hypothetical protein
MECYVYRLVFDLHYWLKPHKLLAVMILLLVQTRAVKRTVTEATETPF